MDASITQCRFLLSEAERIFTGIEDSHLALEPQPGAKTAGWLIGHLAVTGDFARRLCGRRPICAKEWRTAFNPGSQPSIDRATYPSVAELQDQFRAVYTDLIDAAGAVDAQTRAVPNPFAPAIGDFPTAGDFVEYLMSGHLAYHLGQLATWRAAAGLGQSRTPQPA